MRNKRFVLDPNIYISYFISRNDILAEKNNLERRFKKLKILTKVEFEQLFS
jgi:hypothetical protein